MRKCNHCGDEFDQSEQFIELQPMILQRDDMVERENMAWRVHVDCAGAFVDECDSLTGERA